MSEVPPRNALNLWKNGAVALALEGADGQARMLGANNPLPVAFEPGATSDPDSAREVTLQQVLTALLALGGNTDGLEAVAAQQKAVLDQLATYSDGVEGMLSNLNSNTDGIEGLLSSLGLKDDNVLSKLAEILAKEEAIRALLAGTLAVSLAALPLPTGASTEATLAAQKAVIDQMKARLDLLASETKLEQVRALLAALPLPTGASTAALQTTGNTTLGNILTAVGLLGTETTQVAIRNALLGVLSVKLAPDNSAVVTNSVAVGSSTDASLSVANRTVVAVTFGAGLTSTNFYFEHSVDGGATWNAVQDEYGNAFQFVGTAGRTTKLNPAALARLGLIRLRLGTVAGGAVVQSGSAVNVSYTLASL